MARFKESWLNALKIVRLVIGNPSIMKEMAKHLPKLRLGMRNSMTLKIERISDKRRTRIRLSGGFRVEHIDQVNAEIERCDPGVALDLEEVDQVDVDAVRFLNACQSQGIRMLHCSPYIREWMLQERGHSS